MVLLTSHMAVVHVDGEYEMLSFTRDIQFDFTRINVDVPRPAWGPQRMPPPLLFYRKA
jgi:hypothetical protein